RLGYRPRLRMGLDGMGGISSRPGRPDAAGIVGSARKRKTAEPIAARSLTPSSASAQGVVDAEFAGIHCVSAQHGPVLQVNDYVFAHQQRRTALDLQALRQQSRGRCGTDDVVDTRDTQPQTFTEYV